MPWSSNGTYLVTVTDDDSTTVAVYKPGRAERPLWDFPDGLYRREVAAYELAEALGWRLVPETVTRHEGPLDAGSLQLFVDADFEQHYFTLLEEEAHHPALRQMATFDVVANNADRKSGHVLLAEERLWAIDNGLCFNEEDKLRTVIWDFGGEALAADDLVALERLRHDGPPARLCALLTPSEVAALDERAAWLLHLQALPELVDDGGWPPYPWPLV
jgi:uncharacterized repeat protein (TIGR03843 family)